MADVRRWNSAELTETTGQLSTSTSVKQRVVPQRKRKQQHQLTLIFKAPLQERIRTPFIQGRCSPQQRSDVVCKWTETAAADPSEVVPAPPSKEFRELSTFNNFCRLRSLCLNQVPNVLMLLTLFLVCPLVQLLLTSTPTPARNILNGDSADASGDWIMVTPSPHPLSRKTFTRKFQGLIRSIFSNPITLLGWKWGRR